MKHKILLSLFVLTVTAACSRSGDEQKQTAAPAQPQASAPVAAPAAQTMEHSEHGHEGGGHEDSGHESGGHEAGGHAYSFGQPGTATAVTRTVTVTGGDDFKFQPAMLTVKTGETVLFKVKNTGKLPHEFALGDEASQKKHAEMMKQMPDTVHTDPNAITLQAGEEKTLIWQFTQAGKVDFACHVPGHYEAGMVGTITVN